MLFLERIRNKFEKPMREALPELFEHQPDLLFQLVTLLHPEKLKKAEVRVYALDQRAGEFCYHVPTSLPCRLSTTAISMKRSTLHYPTGSPSVSRQPVFCIEELLFSVAGQDCTMETVRWLGPALRRTVDWEIFSRQKWGKY